ncbi:uncharacterized protein LACBIDRAFT_313272 [Laccaria bicolor S238N-H82]|uniref:Predicted protein n=1 Tax=Laccaria bicolor (strain S238N-H82 / ATCC MYA-4686) TaxID=486041 RepID=B0DXY3_LACBS|nr:uncharacterized protein LACBIDRAFT_313272 [Laccaria bicolor S238N-H82]EDR00592.1 predicted protein [Laccaria bicolor S238N-H82]|eukprot:XP_001888819.1 predicted protein [Laccaria bicolor S238N-H82]
MESPYTPHKFYLRSPTPSLPPTIIGALFHPSMIPLLPSPLPLATPIIANPNFEIKDAPHKGFAMYATRDIPEGGLIHIEHPVFIVPNKPLPRDHAGYDQVGSQLPRHAFQEMMTMANCRSKQDCPSPVEGIARTNALSIELKFPPEMDAYGESAKKYGAAFLILNRANHSCGPNAAIKWNLPTLTASMYALRPILAGEEITKTYVDPSLPRSQRIAHLQENYGFTCDCQWCNLPTTSSSLDSDATRAALRIRLLTHPSYPKWSTDLARADDVVLNSHFDALQLIEQEGMHGLQGIYLEEIALCYAILGDEDRFRMWAERLVRRCKVEDSRLANTFESYLDDVRRFKRWAWRRVQRKQMQGKKKRRHRILGWMEI